MLTVALRHCCKIKKNKKKQPILIQRKPQQSNKPEWARIWWRWEGKTGRTRFRQGPHTHLSTASLMSLIHVFRSSLDDVWTSYISGPAAEALIRNIPLSSFATSRTINFCSGITGGFWSFNTFKAWRKKKQNKTSIILTRCSVYYWFLYWMRTTVANVYFWSFSWRKMRVSVSSSARTSGQNNDGWKNS